MAIVYLITNNINGKKYIGLDKKNNPKYFDSGVLIKQSIKKYGKEHFKKTIIEECDESQVYDREKFWITFYCAVKSKEYYNLSEGGKGGNKLNNPKSLEKWEKNRPDIIKFNMKRKGKSYEEFYGNNAEIEKEKRRLGQTGKRYDKKSKKKMSESRKGIIPWNKGLTKEDERVLKNSKNRKFPTAFKEYELITPNGEKLTFSGKKLLKQHIKHINKNLNLKSKINIDMLISKGQEKNYLITIKNIKNGKKFNNRRI
ncbi:MAG: hypothetical protein PF487_09795 [Bacteroidales bacterium]|nr:hypothetical protein [Bacteroidales bacterium]